MDTRNPVNMDSGYAWVVAFANCWVNFSVYGLYRSYGVLYVAFMEVYGVNHQMAAWPFTLLCSIYHLIGPLVGLLSHKFSLRSLQLVGCMIASFGVLGAYFAPSFIYIIFLIGAVQGLGLGVIRTLSNVVIQQYFVKHRATATGIAMCGGTISSFFFPSFAEYILENYGLRISMLVFGAVMLQAILGIALQKPPSWHAMTEDGTTSERLDVESACDNNHNNEPLTSNADAKPNCDQEEKFCDNCAAPINNGSSVYNTTTQPIESNESLLLESCSSSLSASKCHNCSDATIEADRRNRRRSTVISMKAITQSVNAPLKSLVSILQRPMFYVICAMFVTYNIVLQTYLMTIVDIAIENKIAVKAEAILLIVVFSVADLIGRVSFGWISDKGFAQPKTIAIVAHFLMCFFLVLTPVVQSLFALRICAFAVGLLIGIITILWPLLNVDYFGTEKLPLTLGLNCFFSGVESLLRPFAIGYFLDHLDRYDLLFYTVAGCVLMTAILWLFEPVFNRKGNQRDGK